jgi:hypothetical protein
MASNTTGIKSTAFGNGALYASTTGGGNAAHGVCALYYNITGSSNTAEGYSALYSNTTGSSNIAIGCEAGQSIVTGSNNIDIGSTGSFEDAGVTRIGTSGTHTETFVAGINGVTASGGVAVYINSNGQLGTIKSSRRFKFDINEIGAKSDRLMDLRPVMFRYKEAAENGSHPIQFGLIAEEVARVYPDLVQYDKQGKPFTVYYNLLTPLMLSDLQKAHHHLTAQQTEFSALAATLKNQNLAMQSQDSEMGYMLQVVRIRFICGMTLALATLVAVAYMLSTRTLRLQVLRGQPIETCLA